MLDFEYNKAMELSGTIERGSGVIVFCCILYTDEDILIVEASGLLLIHNIKKAEYVFSKHFRSNIRDCMIAQDQTLIFLTTNNPGRVEIFDVLNLRFVKKVMAMTSKLMFVDKAPFSSLYALCFSHRPFDAISVYSVFIEDPVFSKTMTKGVSDIKISTDNRYLFVASTPGSIFSYHIVSGELYFTTELKNDMSNPFKINRSLSAVYLYKWDGLYVYSHGQEDKKLIDIICMSDKSCVAYQNYEKVLSCEKNVLYLYSGGKKQFLLRSSCNLGKIVSFQFNDLHRWLMVGFEYGKVMTFSARDLFKLHYASAPLTGSFKFD